MLNDNYEDGRCTCPGCTSARNTGFDFECHYALMEEMEHREAEETVEFQDTLESLGARRYGNNWCYDRIYVAKAHGFNDEIPF